MKIMILDSGRGHHAALVDGLRAELGLDDADEIVWLARELPKEMLPVSVHLLARNRFGVLQKTLRVQTLLDRPDADVDISAAVIARASKADRTEARDGEGDGEGEVEEDVLGVPSEQLEEQLPESMQEHEHHEDHHTEERVAEATSAPAGPVERVTQAVRWRANKARLVVRGTYRRGKGSARRRIKNSEVPTVVIARNAATVVLPNIGTKFGLATATSRDAVAHAASCDVVFSHDARSHKAAWLLAQRTPHPDVVVGVNAARRAVAERRARG